MDSRTLTQKTGQARGNLMRLERDLERAKGNLKSATRNRVVGGVILLIGMIALIGHLVISSKFIVVIAIAGLFVGGWVFIRALVKVAREHRSIDTITDRVANASAKLTELKAQPSVAE
jgi:Flp pilus assembly protein TadB